METLCGPCALNSAYDVFKIPDKQVRRRGCSFVFLLDHCIKKRLTPASRKRLNRTHAKALGVRLVRTQSRGGVSTQSRGGRWDLQVNLPHGNSNTSVYTRAVAFSLLLRNGRRILPSGLKAHVFSFDFLIGSSGVSGSYHSG